MTDRLTLSDRVFYVTIGSDGLTVYADREEAIAHIGGELQENTETLIVEVRHTTGEEEFGRFEIEPVPWRDLALELAGNDTEAEAVNPQDQA